jgi:hypothetical protein
MTDSLEAGISALAARVRAQFNTVKTEMDTALAAGGRLLSGSGAPPSGATVDPLDVWDAQASFGNDGDFYEDTSAPAGTLKLYGPKANGAWPATPRVIESGGGAGTAQGGRFLADYGAPSSDPLVDPLDGVNDPLQWAPAWQGWGRAWYVTWEAGATIDPAQFPDDPSFRAGPGMPFGGTFPFGFNVAAVGKDPSRWQESLAGGDLGWILEDGAFRPVMRGGAIVMPDAGSGTFFLAQFTPDGGDHTPAIYPDFDPLRVLASGFTVGAPYVWDQWPKVGKDGDFFWDTSAPAGTLKLYGPKVKGKWGDPLVIGPGAGGAGTSIVSVYRQPQDARGGIDPVSAFPSAAPWRWYASYDGWTLGPYEVSWEAGATFSAVENTSVELYSISSANSPYDDFITGSYWYPGDGAADSTQVMPEAGSALMLLVEFEPDYGKTAPPNPDLSVGDVPTSGFTLVGQSSWDSKPGDGRDGDYAINFAAYDNLGQQGTGQVLELWGPKANGHWPRPAISLVNFDHNQLLALSAGLIVTGGTTTFATQVNVHGETNIGGNLGLYDTTQPALDSLDLTGVAVFWVDTTPGSPAVHVALKDDAGTVYDTILGGAGGFGVGPAGPAGPMGPEGPMGTGRPAGHPGSRWTAGIQG